MEWKESEDLPFPLSQASAVTDLEGGVIVLGGINAELGGYNKKVLRFDGQSWQVKRWELRAGITRAQAVLYQEEA